MQPRDTGGESQEQPPTPALWLESREGPGPTEDRLIGDPSTGGRDEPQRSCVYAAQRLASPGRPGPLPDQTGEADARRTSFQVPELRGKDGGRGSRRAQRTRSPCFSEVTARDAPDSGPGGGERAPRRPAAIRPRPGSVPCSDRRARPRRPRAAARGRLRARPRPPPSPTTPGDGGHAGARLTCAGSSGRRW